MHDIRFIREHADLFDAAMARRKLPPQSAGILHCDQQWRSCQTELQLAQSRRNDASKSIGMAKKNGDEAEAQRLMDEVAALKERMAVLEGEAHEHEVKLRHMLLELPNIMADDVADGADEDDNMEIRRVGDPPTIHAPRDHVDIGHDLGLLDFENAAVISGARFAYLRGSLARLERALAAFMIDVNSVEFGCLEIASPALVREDALVGTGQLPKFADDLFKTQDERWLIPTAEVTLTNLVRDRIIAEEELPLRYTAWTPCFRAEAGSAGRDTRGLIRMHQFSKVELVSVTTPEQSPEEHERMLHIAESLLKRLGLSYRVVALCSGDIGFSAAKTYDLEVWIPSQDTYREISSVSDCGPFQARRMAARLRRDGEKNLVPPHTLNGSALAVGRTMVAIMENYQLADGGFAIPEVLQPYMGGLEKIT